MLWPSNACMGGLLIIDASDDIARHFVAMPHTASLWMSADNGHASCKAVCSMRGLRRQTRRLIEASNAEGDTCTEEARKSAGPPSSRKAGTSVWWDGTATCGVVIASFSIVHHALYYVTCGRHLRLQILRAWGCNFVVYVLASINPQVLYPPRHRWVTGSQ